MNQEVSKIDKVTQQTATISEESASASQAMNVQAEMMQCYVKDLVAIVSGGANNGMDHGHFRSERV